MENNAVLKEVNKQFGANYLNEETLLATARKAGFSTAAVGKIGPVFIQDMTDEKGEGTIIIDDATGSPTGISLTQEVSTLISKVLPTASPTRGCDRSSRRSTYP